LLDLFAQSYSIKERVFSSNLEQDSDSSYKGTIQPTYAEYMVLHRLLPAYKGKCKRTTDSGSSSIVVDQLWGVWHYYWAAQHFVSRMVRKS